jgi:acyl-CoA thioesterase FadM
MNLWFRLIWTLLTVRWRKPASLFETTSLRMRVWPNDIDVNGHLNNGRYLTMADIGRVDYILRTGSARVALAQRARPIVGDILAKFRRDLKPFERFEVRTRLLGWEGKWTFLEHRFVRRERVIGIVVMRGLFRSAAGPVAPAVFLDALGISDEAPRLPDWVRQWHSGLDSLAATLRSEETASLVSDG